MSKPDSTMGAKDLTMVPETMGAIEEIQQTFDIANEAGLSLAELDLIGRQFMYIQDQRGALTYATKEATEKGLKEGKEEGRKKMQRSIAQQLLSTLDDSAISQATGLSLEEVSDSIGCLNRLRSTVMISNRQNV